MGTLNHGPTRSERPFTDRHSGSEFWSDIDMPRWDDFTGARDRFFANLRVMAASYRGVDAVGPPARRDNSTHAR